MIFEHPSEWISHRVSWWKLSGESMIFFFNNQFLNISNYFCNLKVKFPETYLNRWTIAALCLGIHDFTGHWLFYFTRNNSLCLSFASKRSMLAQILSMLNDTRHCLPEETGWRTGNTRQHENHTRAVFQEMPTFGTCANLCCIVRVPNVSKYVHKTPRNP